MKFRSRFKLTTLELASLSLLAIGISLVMAMLMIRGCNNNQANKICTTDSIISRIKSAPDLPRDSSTTQIRRRSKAKVNQSSKRNHPVSRNHLDEIVNE